MARALVFARSLVGPSRATQPARSASIPRKRQINIGGAYDARYRNAAPRWPAGVVGPCFKVGAGAPQARFAALPSAARSHKVARGTLCSFAARRSANSGASRFSLRTRYSAELPKLLTLSWAFFPLPPGSGLGMSERLRDAAFLLRLRRQVLRRTWKFNGRASDELTARRRRAKLAQNVENGPISDPVRSPLTAPFLAQTRHTTAEVIAVSDVRHGLRRQDRARSSAHPKAQTSRRRDMNALEIPSRFG